MYLNTKEVENEINYLLKQEIGFYKKGTTFYLNKIVIIF
jgi:hypothetical protein